MIYFVITNSMRETNVTCNNIRYLPIVYIYLYIYKQQISQINSIVSHEKCDLAMPQKGKKFIFHF